VDSELASPAKQRRYGNTVWSSVQNLEVGKVWEAGETASVQQSEAEDDQHKQVCGLKNENTSSAALIL
jgi:hypothetical protein